MSIAKLMRYNHSSEKFFFFFVNKKYIHLSHVKYTISQKDETIDYTLLICLLFCGIITLQ